MDRSELESVPVDYDLPVEEMAKLIPQGLKYVTQSMVNGKSRDGIRFNKGDIGEVVRAEYHYEMSGVMQRVWIKLQNGETMEIQGYEDPYARPIYDDFYPCTSDFNLVRIENPNQMKLFDL